MIKRTLEDSLIRLARQYPIITLTGPRQSGKTTLCRMVFSRKPYVNLENLDTRRLALEDPRGFLSQYPNGAIFDEIQRAPELLSYLQVLVDDDGRKGLFVLTGSQQFEVMAGINQSLAGRTAILKLLPFSLEELGIRAKKFSIDQMLLTGFYPRIHQDGLNPSQALGDYLETYIERDLRQLIHLKDLSTFQKFLRLCAGRVGGLLNMNSLANDTGISHTTTKAWLSLLEAGYVVFLLEPFHANISKRLVKAPKLYFYDVGLAAHLLDLETEAQVSRDPLRGSLFENLVVIEALKYRLHRGKKSNLSFYRDNAGHEVDILLRQGALIHPIEVKAGATINPDFFNGINYFQKIQKAPIKSSPGALIYAGQQKTNRYGTTITTPLGLPHLLKNLEM